MTHWDGSIGLATYLVNANPAGITKLGKLFSGDFEGQIKQFQQDALLPGKVITKDGRIVDKRKEATGGHITGPGTGTSDSIPAMLSNGEYVIRANAVKTIGVDTLNKLNQADRIGFKNGGYNGYSVGGMVPKAAVGGMLLNGKFFSGFADGGYIGPRPNPQWMTRVDGLLATEKAIGLYQKYFAIRNGHWLLVVKNT